jgi:hypothetical protein
MDELEVTITAVIVAALSGLGGIVMAAWTTKRNEKMTREALATNERLTRETFAANERLTRENRIEDKRADAYLELLRLIEREGLALESTMTRLDARTEPDYGQAKPRTTDRPPLSERAAINALLVAFGSRALKLRVESWAEEVKQFDEEYERLAFDWTQNAGDPNEPIETGSLDGLRGVLLAEQQERREVARQIVDELTSLEAR